MPVRIFATANCDDVVIFWRIDARDRAQGSKQRPNDATIFQMLCCETYCTVTFVRESGKSRTTATMSVASWGNLKNVFFGAPEFLSIA